MKKLPYKDSVHSLVHDIAPTYIDRNGGYTRIIKRGFRDNDRASVSIIEFVDFTSVENDAVEETAKKLDNFSHLFSFKKGNFYCLFVLQTIQISAQKSQFKDRYIWVVRSSLVTENSIDRMIEYAVINRFNNIIVQVRGR